MDRASDSGSEGWGFESLPVCQSKIRGIPKRVSLLFYLALRAERDSKIKSKLPVAAWPSPAGRRWDITILQSKIGRVPSGAFRYCFMLESLLFCYIILGKGGFL